MEYLQNFKLRDSSSEDFKNNCPMVQWKEVVKVVSANGTDLFLLSDYLRMEK